MSEGTIGVSQGLAPPEMIQNKFSDIVSLVQEIFNGNIYFDINFSGHN